MKKKEKFMRKCPGCGGKLYHGTEIGRNRADREKRTCGGKLNGKCKVISKAQKKLISKSLLGRAPNHDQKKRRNKLIPTKFERPCPKCSRTLYYGRKQSLVEATKKRTVCDSCNNYIHKKAWKDVITEKSIRKMRASKAGFSSWSEYKKKYPKWLQYKAEVWKYTYKALRDNPTLKNYDKKGRCGVEGAYQIDHIIPLRHGFDNKISPKKIAKYSNLRMIPWEENRKKGSKLID